MRGPKLNEGATVATLASGQRHGTKATAKYVRSSAYKARAVLDLIRGLEVRRAGMVRAPDPRMHADGLGARVPRQAGETRRQAVF